MKESILYNIYQSGKYLSLLLFFLIACDDLEDKPSLVPGESGDVYETGTAEMYILSEGLIQSEQQLTGPLFFQSAETYQQLFQCKQPTGIRGYRQ